MNKLFFFNLLRGLAAFSCSALAVGALAAEELVQPPVAVALDESDCGATCVMIFARVGESFRYELGSESDCRTGEDATGEASHLPAGLRLDKEGAVLEGIPQRSGFYELVVMKEEQGVAREEVLLIDVQGPSFAAGASDYASYFAGGVR